jgi:DNA-directed RNA polymerase subunit N (RpoN/RPB10)/oligoribonuclease (3'-5' exoribonuclease)
MICPDGRIRRCFPVICAWIADYVENVNLHSIRSGFCPVCEAPKSSLGNRFCGKHASRDYSDYSERLEEAYDSVLVNGKQDRNEAADYLDSLGVRLTEGVFWSQKSTRLATAAAPEILHTVYLGVLQHMMKWIVVFLKEHKRMDRFDAIWMAVPAYPDLLKFNKTYAAVSQWTGKEMRALGRILLPVFSAALWGPTSSEKPKFTQAILCVKAMIHFHLMAQYRSHTDSTIQYMEDYLDEFHRHKDVFHQYRAGKRAKRKAEKLRAELTKESKAEREATEGWDNLSRTAKSRQLNEDKTWIESQVKSLVEEESDFNFIKLHLLTHFSEHVKELGHLTNVSAELSERLHRELKDAFRRSNKHNAHQQILQSITRTTLFEYRDLNIEAAKRRTTNTNRSKKPIDRRMQTPQSSIKLLTELATWCGLPPEELQTLVAWCLKTWYECPTYFDSDDEFCRLGGFVYTRHNAVDIPIPCFQSEDEQRIHTIRCTGRDAWRKGQTARNDTVLLWTGTNADSHFAATRGRIPARVDCLFTMSESTGHKTSEFSDPKPIFHLALVTTFAPSNTIHKPEGMVIVEKHEIRSRDYSTGRRRPQTGAGARYIVPVRAIQGAAHLIPIEPGGGNSRWFLNNTVDLEIFNLIY